MGGCCPTVRRCDVRRFSGCGSPRAGEQYSESVPRSRRRPAVARRQLRASRRRERLDSGRGVDQAHVGAGRSCGRSPSQPDPRIARAASRPSRQATGSTSSSARACPHRRSGAGRASAIRLERTGSHNRYPPRPATFSPAGLPAGTCHSSGPVAIRLPVKADSRRSRTLRQWSRMRMRSCWLCRRSLWKRTEQPLLVARRGHAVAQPHRQTGGRDQVVPRRVDFDGARCARRRSASRRPWSSLWGSRSRSLLLYGCAGGFAGSVSAGAGAVTAAPSRAPAPVARP